MWFQMEEESILEIVMIIMSRDLSILRVSYYKLWITHFPKVCDATQNEIESSKHVT